MTLIKKLTSIETKGGQSATQETAFRRLADLNNFILWFTDASPNSPVNKAAELLGLTPNEFKDQIAHEARRAMFVRSVK